MTGETSKHHTTPMRICGTCREPLTWIAVVNPETNTTETAQWTHLRGDEHAPNPIPLEEMTTIHPTCDFCGSKADEGWKYPAGNVIIHPVGDDKGNIQYDDRGWFACDRCSTLIEKGDTSHLAARAATTLSRHKSLPDSQYEPLAGTLADVFTKFALARTGPREPYPQIRTAH